MLGNLYFILVKPQMGENIGAVARVISNFGFYNLRIVSPRDGWPNHKAEQLSAHGLDVLKKAQIYSSLREAVSDLNYLVATTANVRNMDKCSLPIKNAMHIIKDRVNENHKIGLMFGRESSGLSNEELSLADILVNVPTSDINPSLNLSQVAGIFAYELFYIRNFTQSKCDIRNLACKQDIDYLLESLDLTLSKSNFFQVAQKKNTMMRNIRNMIIRMQPSQQDTRTLQGMIKALTIFYPKVDR